MSVDVESWGLSHVGLVRTNNEDVWAQVGGYPFFILADGMGGHRAGEVAAKEAVEALDRIIRQRFQDKPAESYTLNGLKELVYSALVDVNSVVYAIGSSDASLQGMGTTLCCVFVHPLGVIYGHVGDSRIYRLRGHELKQLTEDHTLTTPYIDGPSNPDSPDIQYKSYLTRTIGNDPLTIPDVETTEVKQNDYYLLCSDGLTDMVPFEEIERILRAAPSVRDCVQNLINTAIMNGGNDNVTAIVVKITNVSNV